MDIDIGQIIPSINQFAVLVAWLIGTAIVVGSAKHLFDTEEYDIESGEHAERERRGAPHFEVPLLPKYATSRVPYWTWLAIYLALPVAIFALASWQWKENLPATLEESIPKAWLLLIDNYPPLLVALLMHGMSEVLNGPRSPISWWRLFCLRNARVPLRAREIYLKLKDQPNRAIQDQQQSTINYMQRVLEYPDRALEPGDFEAHPNSMYGKWARACYFMAAIERHPPNNYGKISSRPELRKETIKRNLVQIAEEMADERRMSEQLTKGMSEFSEAWEEGPNHVAGNGPSGVDDRGPRPARESKLLERNVSALLRQVCQYLICVLFAAYRDDERVLVSLRNMGIPISPAPRYKLNPYGLAWSMVIFAGAIFGVILLMVSAGLMPPTGSGEEGSNRGGEFIFATKIAFSAASVIYFPALFVFVGKFLMVSSWEVRGRFSERRVAAPLFVSAVTGAVVGFVGFLVLGAMDLLRNSEQWLTYSPFCILSSLTACIAAWCVDYESRQFVLARSIVRAARVGGVSVILFVLLGIISLGVHHDLVKEEGGSIWVAALFFGLVGLFTAFLISVSSDYFGRIPTDRDEEDLILARYVEPYLPVRFSAMTRDELDAAIAQSATRWGSEVSSWLKGIGMLNDELNLTDTGFRRLTWRDEYNADDGGAHDKEAGPEVGGEADRSAV